MIFYKLILFSYSAIKSDAYLYIICEYFFNLSQKVKIKT